MKQIKNSFRSISLFCFVVLFGVFVNAFTRYRQYVKLNYFSTIDSDFSKTTKPFRYLEKEVGRKVCHMEDDSSISGPKNNSSHESIVHLKSMRDKAILSKDDLEYVKSTLSSSILLDNIVSLFETTYGHGNIIENEPERMDAISFMIDALLWENNPLRDRLRQSALEIILMEKDWNNIDQYERSSLIADKIELLQALNSIDSVFATRIYRLAGKSPVLLRTLAYLTPYNLSERSLAHQIDP